MTTQAAADMASPCVRECVIDQSTGYCIGCLRTLHEISFWTRYTPGERARVVAVLATRRAGRGPGATVSQT